MGMTLTQKILAAHAGLAEVKAGQLINAKLDIVLGNDITCLLYTSFAALEVGQFHRHTAVKASGTGQGRVQRIREMCIRDSS